MNTQKEFNQIIGFTATQFQSLLEGDTDFIYDKAGGAITNMRLTMQGFSEGKMQIRVEGKIEQQVN